MNTDDAGDTIADARDNIESRLRFATRPALSGLPESR